MNNFLNNSHFQNDFNKSFASVSDEHFRMNIFAKNVEKVRLHNKMSEDGIVLFKMGLNQFADMTFKEFLKRNEVNEEIVQVPDDVPFDPVMFENDESIKIPFSFDWRDHGVVSRVKDQKSCGSCYAMATVDSIESHLMIKTGKLIELSVQEIVDCAGDFETWGCEGGIKFRVYDYIKIKGGLSTSIDYPFEGAQLGCKRSQFAAVPIHLKSYVEIPSNDEELLKLAVIKSGPIAVSIDINHESFMRYASGIYEEPNCTSNTNHAALLVGYGSEDGKDFWILKNSYGVIWGEAGYIRVARNPENLCGIASESFYPLLE